LERKSEGGMGGFGKGGPVTYIRQEKFKGKNGGSGKKLSKGKKTRKKKKGKKQKKDTPV